MVTDQVWAKAKLDPAPCSDELGIFICIRCLEARLGRTLNCEDFPDVEINDPCEHDTPLLAKRKRTPALTPSDSHGTINPDSTLG